jgi:hypothetical protein
MATVLEEFTTEVMRSLLHFFVGKALNAKDMHREMKRFTGGSKNVAKFR